MSLLLDDLLFDMQINTGMSALLWLGELVSPDRLSLWDCKKITMPHTLKLLPVGYLFWLPQHKGNVVFEETKLFAEGSQVLLILYPLCGNT